ncbi:Rhodanese-related sulfurtransferase [Bathymodiolus thermophilus thioautotrophic gill symbiont]|uniref:Sulfurtransferase n=1 Tax=Bathymodiolus thermophilus thioautotrophic gill symbiont TaxID=2360 RepID=A0A1J5TUM5_9GAMM|nr:rhodanese-like domain-containing protein [Bathymodiolus thermophilus thioautotrophic gill symbiont]AYQ55907.1 Rhodanese-related sulfurtransferase [Bathymodiolus thermophilus thioautotrophic gill symbiont]OIR24507.1 sulfurtransferase [Bathymodiolus thermophilus thioautotrophic gill symbiont]CAB5493902.1 Rhodanese-related sulfurtransferase [Bathymodiolus thermophilus thioautotrophic gill symbiont]CAB5498639.1 Rhodanese-related sulfurtransferase [Bathymodiolus thermophilus thioautotrophic gill 
MDDYQKLVEQALESVSEIMPWDLEEDIPDTGLILLDIREQDEFNRMHIPNSIHIPRGLLESACVWNYDDTVPMLAASRNQNIVLICRSGNRSVLAAQTLQQMGFENVRSLKLGIKGWNDNDFEMLDIKGNIVDIDQADEWLNRAVTDEKRQPNS